jgi:hypothetical protein
MASKKMNYDAINFKNKDVDKFSTRFGKGDPIKLKNSPLSAPAMEATKRGTWDPLAKAHYTADAAWSAADRIDAKNQLKKENPKALSSYGYQTTSKGNIVDENFKQATKTDAKRLRNMATNRPISEDGYKSEQSLRGRKLAEGIQTPSMEKAKKPVMAAPKIDVKAAKAKVKADAKREFYTNSKGKKVYVD